MGFPWSDCAGEDLATRVGIKQQAVDDALVYSRQLCDKLLSGIRTAGPANVAAFDMMGGKEIGAWTAEMGEYPIPSRHSKKLSANTSIAELERTSKKLKILIGVIGATGAGKTSLLNSILECPELLPSSSTEAATATVCRIAWNHDDTAGREFRAKVVFRDKDDVVKELEEVLNAVKERKALMVEKFERETERFEAIDAVTDIISKGVAKVCAVWGLDEAEIEDLDYTVESVLEKNDQIVNLLGKILVITSSDADAFAAEVKPYLDSTPTPGGITAWPLIEQVKLYVKSDILKHGIVLVDLPGLSDTVESRSAIAENYSQNLSITAIVTPAIRAADEKTGLTLMESHQELRMQLDGKYHKDSFCVVVSKIDDIDVDAHCTQSKDAIGDTRLQACTDEIETTLAIYDMICQRRRISKRECAALVRTRAKLRKRISALKAPPFTSTMLGRKGLWRCCLFFCSSPRIRAQKAN